MPASSSPASSPSPASRDARPDTLKKRLIGITATIIAEVLVIALLFTLSWNLAGGEEESAKVTTIAASNISSEAPEDAAEPEQAAQPEEQPVQQPQTQPRPQPEPRPNPLPPPPLLLPRPTPTSAQAAPPPPRAQPSPAPPPAPRPVRRPAQGPPARTYGPPNTGGSSANDSRRVGTAPNGEPLYAARWYREPTRQELAGYLSTATGPATALIVCRTVPDFYVEDCQLLGESPRGSQIGRAVLAAAWQFRVRPAVVGGRSQVGSWVRIKIDYTRAVSR